jgi:acyl carrier protein
MSPTPAELASAQALVARALSISTDGIDVETQMYDVPAWDSFGQLSVILAVEQALGAEITDPAVFQSLTSVRGIAAFLSVTPRSSPPGSW